MADVTFMLGGNEPKPESCRPPKRQVAARLRSCSIGVGSSGAEMQPSSLRFDSGLRRSLGATSKSMKALAGDRRRDP